ncbi:hypothetical protein HDV57DRAFT_402031 [Trichoderma longibrachiatum]
MGFRAQFVSICLKQENKRKHWLVVAVDRGSSRRGFVGEPAKEAELEAGANQRGKKERQRGRERVALEKMVEDGSRKRRREARSESAVRRLLAVREGPVCRWTPSPSAVSSHRRCSARFGCAHRGSWIKLQSPQRSRRTDRQPV